MKVGDEVIYINDSEHFKESIISSLSLNKKSSDIFVKEKVLAISNDGKEVLTSNFYWDSEYNNFYDLNYLISEIEDIITIKDYNDKFKSLEEKFIETYKQIESKVNQANLLLKEASDLAKTEDFSLKNFHGALNLKETIETIGWRYSSVSC